MEQITQLLRNKWIDRCEGPWGSMIVLAQKPHQENIINIADFIWRMCVSYRRLNTITKIFQFPIPRCDDAIIILDDGARSIWIISLGARQGYHQIAVRQSGHEKLAFFAPDDRKYTFNMMLFGSTNAPLFCTAMMKDMKDEWDKLFVLRLMTSKTFDGKDIRLSAAEVVTIDGKSLIYGIKTIIDNILLWCDMKNLSLLYLS